MNPLSIIALLTQVWFRSPMEIAVAHFSLQQALAATNPLGGSAVRGFLVGDRATLRMSSRTALVQLTLDLIEAGGATVLRGHWGPSLSGALIAAALCVSVGVTLANALSHEGPDILGVAVVAFFLAGVGLAAWMDARGLVRFLKDTLKADPQRQAL